MLISYPQRFTPHRVKQNVSTLDLLPTLCDLVDTKPIPGLPMDGISLLPHLEGKEGHDTVIAEYAGEGTITPLAMIRRGPWKYITCPSDPPQLFNLERDPHELINLAEVVHKKEALTAEEKEAKEKFEKFTAEAEARWNFKAITDSVFMVQRQRRLVWSALQKGKFTPWDYNPNDDGTNKYVSPHFLYICYHCISVASQLTAVLGTFVPSCPSTILNAAPVTLLWINTAARRGTSLLIKRVLTMSNATRFMHPLKFEFTCFAISYARTQYSTCCI